MMEEIRCKMKALNMLLVFYFISLGYTEGSQDLHCPAPIKRFQAELETAFYECEDGIAKLKQCRNGTKYVPYIQKCIPDLLSGKRKRRDISATSSKKKKGEKPQQITQQTLSQSALLGTLYNSKTDQYSVSKNLWNKNTREKNQQIKDDIFSNTKYFAARTSVEKLDQMNINAELKMSFMAGLIQVSGAAQFYRESNVYDNEEVFNMVYQATTHRLYMADNVVIDNGKYCKQRDVTHVVSSVKYGLNAFFNFRKRFHNETERQKLAGTLNAMVKAIPSFTIEGKASLETDANRKNVYETTTVSLHGDFLLRSSPTTFRETIEAYKEVTGLLIKSRSNAQIVEVTLSPIQEFCDDSTVLLTRISEQVLQTVINVLDKLEKIKINIETLLNTRAARKFVPVKKNLNEFLSALKIFQNDMKSKLQLLLPKIKSGDGKESETDLVALINKFDNSQYCAKKIDSFLANRKREIEALHVLLDQFKPNINNVQVIDYEGANDVKIRLETSKVVVFDINILVPTLAESYLNGKLDETSLWYNKDDELERVSEIINRFKDFADSNKNRKDFAYLIKVNKKTSTSRPTSLKAKAKPFFMPHRPESLKLKQRSYDKITFHLAPKPKNSWNITNFVVVYWNYAEIDQYKKYKKIYFSAKNIDIKGLEAATPYKFQIYFETEFGRSPTSDETEIIFTRPSSPPTNIQGIHQTASSFTVTWGKPLHIGHRLSNSLTYSIVLLDKTKKEFARDIVKGNEATFHNLTSYQPYLVKISANVNNTSSDSSEYRIHTAPPSLKPVTVREINLNEITIQWVKPDILLETTDIKYVVKYFMMDSIGKSSIGEAKTLTDIMQPTTTVAALAEGTYYGFQVQVVTSDSSSLFSPMASVKTKFQETRLDKLKKNIIDQLAKPIKSLTLKIENAENVATNSIDILSRKLKSTSHQIDSAKLSAANARSNLKKDIIAVGEKVNKMIPVKNVCKMIYTVYHTNGGGKHSLTYLDYHNLQCDPGYVLTSFQLENNKNGEYRYVGKCCSNGRICDTKKKTNPTTNNGGEGKFFFLDRQEVSCRDSQEGHLTGFKLDSSGGRSGYSYNCCKSIYFNQPYAYNTNLEEENNGDTTYLSRQKVECPTGTALLKFQLNRVNVNSRYKFECGSYL